MVKASKEQIEILVKRAKEGEMEALEILIEIFTPYCINQCKKVYLVDYDFDELFSISKFSIVKAVHKYDVNRKSFPAYVTIAIRKNIYNVIKKSIKKEEKEINVRETKTGIPIVELIESEVNTEELIVYREKIEKLCHALKSLTKQERKIIAWYYLENRSIKKYADENQVDYWNTSKIKQRALKKMRKYMEENS